MTSTSSNLKPLKGVRVLSTALNLPGPAALMRLKQMGATCTKLEPPAQPLTPTADPMGVYKPEAYKTMHRGIRLVQADLKTPLGQSTLHQLLAQTDVLITSFRPSALTKLGLDWKVLHRLFPSLCMVGVVGAPGPRAEEPGHDLTYLAENELIQKLDLPPTLYADMAGSLMVTEAVLGSLLARQRNDHQSGAGVFQEIALLDAASYLALPRTWGLSTPDGDVGGLHAGYKIYPCKNGRVAVAALEPHFAARLCLAAGLPQKSMHAMREKRVHTAFAKFFATQTRRQLDRLAIKNDIPLHTLVP
jgi:crotonobetainyl-CoA:carnitine CoA-transferase CaiB-like acyl-CoA transferase